MAKRFLAFLKRVFGLVPLPPITSVAAFIPYAEKQAAYVSQVTLYGYIKTRAGTQWPKLFENQTYLVSMKIARWHIFGAAVADLAIYFAALLVKRGVINGDDAESISSHIITAILGNYDQDDISKADFDAMLAAGLKRCQFADWAFFAEGGNAFKASADALIKWTPIADELKDQDEEIVRNSIHIKWINVRRDIIETLVADAVAASYSPKP